MSNNILSKPSTLTNLAVGSALLTALSPASFAAESDKQVDDVDTITIVGVAEGINSIDSTATKMNLSLKDTGRSMIQVTDAEISDMAAEDTRDLAEYVAGFHSVSSADRRVVIRGIDTNIDNFMVNGLRSLQGGETGTGSRLPSTYNIESATFLSGSDAILYGSGVGGGTVNVVTKKPQEKPETTLGVNTRSFASGDTGNFKRNQISVSIDSTGKLIGDDVLYRVNAQLTPDGEHYQEGRDIDEQLIDASLTFKAGENTRITPRVEYTNRERTGGSSWTDGVFTDNFADGSLGTTTNNYGEVINRGSYYGSPLDNGYNKSVTAELHVEHQLKNWTFNARASATQTESESQDLYISSGFSENVIGATTLERKWVYAKGEDEYALLDVNAEGKFETGILKHHLLTGINVRNKETKLLRNFQSGNDALGQYTISVEDPNDQLYSSMPSSLKEGEFDTTTDDEYNIYLKDRISLGDFTLALGAGYINYKGEEISDDDDSYSQNVNDFIYDVGLVYKLNADINLFTSYSQAYEPIDTSNLVQYGVDGTDYLPEESDNYELGFKGEFFDKRLSTSVTAFYINTKNPTSLEGSGEDRALVQDIGETFRSTGVEIDATFNITDQLSSKISYAYTDAHDTTGDDEGVQADYTPYNALSIWNSYSLADEPIRFALGMRSESSRNSDGFNIPGYAEFDFGTYYEAEDWALSLIVRNMFDESRVVTSPNWESIEANDPRSINLSFKYRL